MTRHELNHLIGSVTESLNRAFPAAADPERQREAEKVRLKEAKRERKALKRLGEAEAEVFGRLMRS